ncbi:MAG: hypothetical protein WC994_09765 [Brumimicrobium sp.]
MAYSTYFFGNSRATLECLKEDDNVHFRTFVFGDELNGTDVSLSKTDIEVLINLLQTFLKELNS